MFESYLILNYVLPDTIFAREYINTRIHASQVELLLRGGDGSGGGGGGGDGPWRSFSASVRPRVARVWSAVRARAVYVLGSLLVYETLLHAVPAWTLVRHVEYLERRELAGFALVALPTTLFITFFTKVFLISCLLHCTT